MEYHKNNSLNIEQFAFVCKQSSSRLKKIFHLVLSIGTICLFLALSSENNNLILLLISSGVFLFSKHIFNDLAASKQSSNWVLAVNEQRLFIKFRSYIDYKLDENDETIVSFHFSELEKIQKVKYDYRIMNSRAYTKYTGYCLDIHPYEDCQTQLKAQLKTEQQRKRKEKK